MRDCHSRPIRYLRLSLTGACGMRCTYCRPAEPYIQPSTAALRPAELETLVRALVSRYGLTKVRLTGGEPTARPDLLEIIQRLSRIEGLQDLGLTTNGLTLVEQAPQLAQAGLTRINISLDSLDPKGFQQITGVNGLSRVLAGIETARKTGLPLKLNTVVLRHLNDDQLPALVRFAVQRSLELRFIELMPMGPLADQWEERFVPEAEIRLGVSACVAEWLPLPVASASARRFEVRLSDGGHGVVGFISAMSCPFCQVCDRIRVASDGTLYPCLMGAPTSSVLPALRPVFDEARLAQILTSGLTMKAETHPHAGVALMTHIGG